MRVIKWLRIVLPGSLLILPLCLLFVSTKAHAIPVFSRKYQTSCTTCHLDFPKLNDFGKAFKDAGFKFPQDDETFVKQAPTLLGAAAQKDVFPHSVWPGEIPGMPPIGLRMNSFFQITGNNRNRFNVLAEPGTAPQVIPRTDFQTGLFSIFMAGNFGSDIAFWVDADLNVGGSNSAGGLGDAYLRFVNIGRFLKLPKDSLSFRVGQFELDLPFTQARNINLSSYDIFAQANIGAATGAQQNVANQFTMADAAKGVEVSGGHNYGGYHYSFAVFNQNTSGLDQTESPFVPSATGFASDSSFKNVYARFAYRFNLESNSESRKAVQAAGTTGPHDHTFLNLGTFYLRGKSQQALVSGSNVLYAREPYYRAGGDFSFNYRTFNLFGVYMYGRDDNQLPVDANGDLIELPLGSDSPAAVKFVSALPAKFNGGFLEADYLIHPWLMAIGRWDVVHSSADRINGLALSPDTPFFAPFTSTRSRFTPGIQFLIRPNIKASFEYQIRPRQFVTVVTDPVTGAVTAVNPFRVNTALFGLEFVY